MKMVRSSWLQFSLRTALLLMLGIGLFFGGYRLGFRDGYPDDADEARAISNELMWANFPLLPIPADAGCTITIRHKSDDAEPLGDDPFGSTSSLNASVDPFRGETNSDIQRQ